MEEDTTGDKRCSKGDDCKNEGGPDQPLSNFYSKEGVAFAPNANRYIALQRIEDRRSTIPDRVNQIAQIKVSESGSASTRVVLRDQ